MYSIEKTRIFVDTKIENILLFTLSVLSLACPLLVHSLGWKGTEFLPIFFTLSLASCFMSFNRLAILAIVNPTINMLLTGMPPVPIYYFLVFEGLAFVALLVVLRKRNVNFYLAMPISFIFARFSSIIISFFIDSMPINRWFSGVINGYKGIIVNILISLLLFYAFGLIKKNSKI